MDINELLAATAHLDKKKSSKTTAKSVKPSSDLIKEADKALARLKVNVKEHKREKKRKTSQCKEDGCSEIVYQAGLCEKHWLGDRKKKDEIKEGKIWISTDGYKRIYARPIGGGEIKIKYLSRHVIEVALNRELDRSEKVIFKDKDKLNCDLSNLLLQTDQAIDFSTLVCATCGNALLPQALHPTSHTQPQPRPVIDL